MFSGGASSSYVAWLVSQKQKKEDIILLHTPTGAEDKDADRFREQIAKFIGIEITHFGHELDLWELIEKNHCLPSQFIPFCTTELKIKQSRKFWKSLGEDYIVYFGYSADEWRRVQKQTARFEIEGVKAQYPVFEMQISDTEIKRIITQEWKICLPEPYKHLQHNNCIPCWKGGKGHWRAVARYYPEEYEKACKLEEEIGHTVFKDCTLRELQKQELSKLKFEFETIIPCECAY